MDSTGKRAGMWLRDMFFGLGRRWYLLALFLLMTAGLCLLVKASVPTIYRAQGSLVLMPPTATVGPEGNPFLFLGGMGQALDILAVEMASEDTAKPIRDAYPGTSYSAEPDRSSSGSVIRISVEGDDPLRVQGALKDAVAVVPSTLTAMQETQNVPESARIRLMTLVVQDNAREDSKTRTFILVGAAGAGTALSVLLTGFIDGRLLARTERRKAVQAPASVPKGFVAPEVARGRGSVLAVHAARAERQELTTRRSSRAAKVRG